MNVKAYFDKDTSTLTYVVYDQTTKDAVLIDPVLDYDPASSKYTTKSIDKATDFIKSNSLKLHYILETHAHADHLSGAQLIKQDYPTVKIAIGAKIKDVQKTFKHVFNFKDFNENGIQFDILLEDNSTLAAGSLSIKTLYTPGHTPACVSYYINEDSVFTGDVLFMHDYGTGRCDFPGGSSEQMYDSVKNRLYTIPDQTKVYVGHDYLPGGRAVQYESTIAQQKQLNPQLNDTITKEEFVKNRDDRDKTLKAPKLLLQSLQVNIDAGNLPTPESNGARYLKIPIRK
ncbi:MBL fold metallo-hydrolase [Candidatus Marinamargulisbacteria bacterium SCGC AAA071-K20]|nr:MBL fold metallo-hydrolase [Candidatus Marinamargulisbacteria bacterium SCGC AAA071-K20]